MVLEKIGFKIGIMGKTEEQKLRYARSIEAKEHLDEAYRECKNIIEDGKIKGLACICSKIQDRGWLDRDNKRIREKLYE